MSESWKSQCPLSVLKQRAFLLSKIREFFNQNNVLEVETPILSSSGNSDIHIESFTAEKINTEFSKSYLRTSPEFPLKRLLCSGIGDVFELGKVFRKGEYSKAHNCEFSMLEWYRTDYNYKDLIIEVGDLLRFIFSCFNLESPIDVINTFDDCFKKQFNFDVFHVSDDSLNRTCDAYGYSGSYLNKDEALDYLFATQIQPNFNPNSITFVTHYPASQAALAEINSDDSNTSLRFEVFYQGHELGNGYQELTNSSELLGRFNDDNVSRLANNLPVIQLDNHLLDAMQNGMPKCSGIAMGIDRLFMVLLGKDSIHDVMPFNAENS